MFFSQHKDRVNISSHFFIVRWKAPQVILQLCCQITKESCLNNLFLNLCRKESNIQSEGNILVVGREKIVLKREHFVTISQLWAWEIKLATKKGTFPEFNLLDNYALQSCGVSRQCSECQTRSQTQCQWFCTRQCNQLQSKYWKDNVIYGIHLNYFNSINFNQPNKLRRAP